MLYGTLVTVHDSGTSVPLALALVNIGLKVRETMFAFECLHKLIAIIFVLDM